MISDYGIELAQKLECGCNIRLDKGKANGHAEITFCSKEHAFIVWMGWNESVFDKLQVEEQDEPD